MTLLSLYYARLISCVKAVHGPASRKTTVPGRTLCPPGVDRLARRYGEPHRLAIVAFTALPSRRYRRDAIRWKD
jgi:hypothetical protein